MQIDIAKIELSLKDGRPIDLRLPHNARELLQEKADAEGKTPTKFARELILNALFGGGTNDLGGI